MITRNFLLLSITCCLLSSMEGQAQRPNSFKVTKTQATLTTPSLVQLMCAATSHPAIESVVWYDVNGDKFNSTSLVRDEQDSTVIVATLEVERRVCVDTVYTCVFENGMSSYTVELECPPIPRVSFEASTYTVGEGEGRLRICLSVHNVTNGTALTITETDRTASRRSDFTLPRVFDLTITPEKITSPTCDVAHTDGCLCGQLCFNVPISQDIVFEAHTESFGLRVTVHDVLAPSTSQTTVYIQDDDELVIGFEKAEYTFQEGDEGCTSKVRLCLQIKEVILGLPLEVLPVWTAGTAVEGVDYHAPPCNFTFHAGSYVDCMDLIVVNDRAAELPESLSVALGGVLVDGRGVAIGNRVRTNVGEALIHITDNDLFELLFDESEYTVGEGGPGESHTALRVCLTQGEGGAQSADLGKGQDTLIVDLVITSQDGTATGNQDYASINSTLSVQLPLSESVCECVEIHHDQVVEATETFTLQLTTSHPLVNTNNSTARVLLRDNSQSALTVGFERPEYSVREEYGGVEVCVILIGHYQRAVHTLLSTVTNTATENLDFVEIENHRLSFPVDQFSLPLTDGRVCLNVSVLSDTLLEPDEEFTLSLRSTDPAVHLATSTTTVVILDNQGTVPTLSFTDNTPSVAGNEVRAIFTITQSQQLSSVNCSLSGPGRTPTLTKDCSSGHVTFTNLPLRRQQFILSVSGQLYSRPHPLTLATVNLRLDHSLCWLHPINEGVMVGEDRVTFQWQGTGPAQHNRVPAFLCRKDRERFEEVCISPYVWMSPSPGNHVLHVTPMLTGGCRRHITRVFDFYVSL